MFKKNRTAFIVAAVLGIAAAPSAMVAPKALCQAYANVADNQSNSMNPLHLGCFGSAGTIGMTRTINGAAPHPSNRPGLKPSSATGRCWAVSASPA